jgi:hypothetical protein
MERRIVKPGDLIATGAQLTDGLYWANWDGYRMDIIIPFTQVAKNGLLLQPGDEICQRTYIDGGRRLLAIEIIKTNVFYISDLNGT